jgi:hypothetical protein
VFPNGERGTAKLALLLPGPGRLVLSGKGIKRVTRHPGKAGGATLRIKPKGKLKPRLINRGEAKVDAEVTFKPKGGHARTRSKTVKLVRQ